MTPEIPEIFQLIDPVITTISLSGLVALMFWWGVKPFIPLLVSYFTGKLTEKSIEKNLMECFTSNHFSDFEKRITKLENDCDGIREDVRFIKNSHDEIQRELLKIQIKLDI